MYINEIIRVTYKCNWKCKFCNVLKTNNFWENDITSKEIIIQILDIARKYSKDELNNTTLSLSWWEPTLNNKLSKYIKLSKAIWVWNVQIQTNWSTIFSDFTLLEWLIDSWLDEIFFSNHSNDSELNKAMWSYTNTDNFFKFLAHFEKNNLNKKVRILTNIVVNKFNISTTKDYISFLIKNNYFKIIDNNHLSIWFVQPNWYANINKDEVLLKYDEKELNYIKDFVLFCESNWLSLDFHFTAPPICTLDYREYNLEYDRLKQLENDKTKWNLIEPNLEKYEWLWKEKQKFSECNKCKYNDYCLWFYKNWLSFVWDDYAKEKINNFLKNGK